MTSNHLLLYRLAELMLEHEQHVLPVDLLFDDDQIGDFVKGIQIDSPYQQMLLEGVLTESVRDEKLFVSFTVEGYFHFVLGEVIYNQSEGKEPKFLKQIVEENKLNGAKEGIEQCLIRDVQKNELKRLIWLIDEGGKTLEISSYPLAQAFLIHPIYKIMDELLSDTTDNDIEALEKAIKRLESSQLNTKVSAIYKEINHQIEPKTIKNANLYVKSIEYIPEDERTDKLDRLNQLEITAEDEESGLFYSSLGAQYDFIANFDKAIYYYEKSHAIYLKVHGDQHPLTGTSYNNLGSVWCDKGVYDKAIDYYEKSLSINFKVHGELHPLTGDAFNNLGLVLKENGEYDKAMAYYEKSLEISVKVHGNHHPATGISYNNLGSFWLAKGEHDKAIACFEKALGINIKVYEEHHLETSLLYNNLGAVWRDKGDCQKAILYYEKTLNINLKVHGDVHPIIASSYDNLGSAWSLCGSYNKALEFHRKAVSINLRVHGNEHPSTGISYNGIGNIYRDIKDSTRAKEYYGKAYDVFYKSLGINHPHTQLLKEKLEKINDI